MSNEIEIRAEKRLFRNCVDLMVFQSISDEEIAIGKPVILEKTERGAAFTEPTISLNYEQAQMLIDELWRCGLRPTEGHGSAGMLAATERHLSDMKKIAFNRLKINE